MLFTFHYKPAVVTVLMLHLLVIMQRSHLFFLVGIFAVLCVGAIITYFVVSAPDPKGPSAASMTLQTSDTQIFTDLQGEPISLDQYEGKIRVVNVWASWSPLSIQELQDMQRFADDYAGDDVVFLAVNRKEHAVQAQSFLDTYDIGGEIIFVIDLNDTFYTSIGGYAMPETVVYDQEGDIVTHRKGVLSYDDLSAIIQTAQ